MTRDEWEQQACSRRFVDRKQEAAFCAHTFDSFQGRGIRYLTFGYALFMTMLSTLYFASMGQPALTPQLGAVIRDSPYFFATAVFGERIAHVSMLCRPTVAIGVALAARGLSARSYARFLRVAMPLVLLSCFGPPLVGALIYASQAKNSSLTETAENFSCEDDRPEELPVLLARVAHRSASYVGTSILMYSVTVLLSPDPLIALQLLAICFVINLARACITWRVIHDIEIVAQLWFLPMHVAATGASLMTSYLLSHVFRENYRIHHELKTVKDLRIEQLAREKERLNYERVFALRGRRQESSDGSSGPSPTGRSFQPAAEKEGRAADLEGRAADLEGRAADLEGRAADLEGRAADLEGRDVGLECREADFSLESGRAATCSEVLTAPTSLLEEAAYGRDANATALATRAEAVEATALHASAHHSAEATAPRGDAALASPAKLAELAELTKLTTLTKLAELTKLTTLTKLAELSPEELAEFIDESEVSPCSPGELEMFEERSRCSDANTCSEVEALLAIPHRSSALCSIRRGCSPSCAGDHGDPGRGGEGTLHLFPLLPQFYGEVRDERVSLTWLHDESERRMRALRVHEGRLVDHDGRPLGGSQCGTVVAIFVLDAQGSVMLTVEHLTRPFHHSSFVAGAPVAAAGEMTVDDGWLIAITNESGHYAPPPSCLRVVFERLHALGVARLDRVRVEPTWPPAMCLGTPPPTAQDDDAFDASFSSRRSTNAPDDNDDDASLHD